MLEYKWIIKFLCELYKCAQKRKTKVWIETQNEYSTGRTLQKHLMRWQFGNLEIIKMHSDLFDFELEQYYVRINVGAQAGNCNGRCGEYMIVCR